MIESYWINKGLPVKSVWLPLDNLDGISPIHQSYGVCFNDNKEVMVIRNPLEEGGFKPWNLPGGTPEEGETPVQTLIREVDEEADISITDIKLLGAVEVLCPGNSNKEKGDHYYQLRFFAKISEIRDQTPDPSDNKMVERKLIPAGEFTDYIKWGPVGEELIKVALEEFEKSKNFII
ncbi:MAG: NUDIX hydrolase [Patescibacteria group bacterium]|jgi:ADP-ribose pyrophosphatase YjhB (NUDIX family)